MKTITVYGSSQVRPQQPEYEDAAAIGRALARAGYAVMSGGYYGVMEAVSKGAKSAGGRVIGVTTDQIGLQFNVEPNAYLDEIVNFADLRDRLLYMVEHADGYLAMPGGIGTLHEIAETWELMRIGGVPRRPFVCYGELWATVIGELENSAYLGDGYHGMIEIALCPDEALKTLALALTPR
ncbi:MAG: LOG family protein [Chloroflexi bacterium]|nr:LOG family protein [Chloroflexota bacterium]